VNEPLDDRGTAYDPDPNGQASLPVRSAGAAIPVNAHSQS